LTISPFTIKSIRKSERYEKEKYGHPLSCASYAACHLCGLRIDTHTVKARVNTLTIPVITNKGKSLACQDDFLKYSGSVSKPTREPSS
jgi:ferredoxin